MFRFVKNNGITEGFRRKIKLIQRWAYVFRNFENCRMQVLVLCGWGSEKNLPKALLFTFAPFFGVDLAMKSLIFL